MVNKDVYISGNQPIKFCTNLALKFTCIQYFCMFYCCRNSQSCPADRVAMLCCSSSTACHPAAGTNCSVPVADYCTSPVSIGLLQQRFVRTFRQPHPASSVGPERCCTAHLPYPTVWAYHCRAHQPSLAACTRTYRIQTGCSDLPIHPRHFTRLPTVVFHPRRRHNFETTAAVFYIWPAWCISRPSLYSRHAGVSGLWCQHLERSADTHDIRAVTRGLQTTSQDIPFHSFLSEHFYLTCFLTFSVDLAIADFI